MSHSFTAIDFETAQGYRHSICQVGLIRVEYNSTGNFLITDKLNILVQPPENYYWENFTDIHGIDARKTKNAPTFDKIWKQLKPFIENQMIVAHNIGFDNSCLIKTLEYYNVKVPEYSKNCTYRIYGKGLAECCRIHKIALNHHDALSDAMACAELYKRHLEK